MAALRLDDPPKGNSLPLSIPDATNNGSLKGKTSISAPSQEPQTIIKATDLPMGSILEHKPANPSLRRKQFDVEQESNEDEKDLEFLDNILDSESTSKKPASRRQATINQPASNRQATSKQPASNQPSTSHQPANNQQSTINQPANNL